MSISEDSGCEEAIHLNASEEFISLNIESSPTKLLDPANQKPRFLDFLKSPLISADWYERLRFTPLPAIFRQNTDRREEISVTFTSPIHRHFDVDACKEWLQHPKNIALLVWLICVSISSAMLGLLLLGLLNGAFPTKSSRNHWIEVNNQFLNALFTLMSLYQHPTLFHHLVLLCRWRADDIKQLRITYCKTSSSRPRERVHMVVVLVLLHVTCFSQYFLCNLYWGYSLLDRPEFAENSLVILGTVAPVVAGAYTVYSPLGQENNLNTDEELQCLMNELKTRNQEWAGGLFDCRDDYSVGCLSFFCMFCVFGWNMERLGFGNMYVHLVTFLLLCIAPFLIFNTAALRIHDQVIGDMVGVAGIVLCVFGLVYGGFWRVQMRKRFKIRGGDDSSVSAMDYVKWILCWSCALAQEVRTGNLYEGGEEGVCGRGGGEEGDSFLRPLPREGGSSGMLMVGLRCGSPELEEDLRVVAGDSMVCPVQPLMSIGGGGSDGVTVLAPMTRSLLVQTDGVLATIH